MKIQGLDYKLIRNTHRNIVFIIFYSLSSGLQALPSLGATHSNSNNLGNNNTSINQLNKKIFMYEFNLEKTIKTSQFDQTYFGPATQTIPNFVEDLINDL